jgi:nucleotide-binding universal stress UspA family protein
MKKILVATDFTKYADYAINTAASIAKKTKASLILIHVINRPLDANDETYDAYHNMPGGKITVSNIQNQLDASMAKHQIEGAKLIYELKNDVCETILNHADTEKVDLIILGGFGSKGTGEVFTGSNTEKVMLQAKIPVLIVKENFSEFNIENIVLASEFYGEVYNVFPQIKKITDLLGSTIHLLKVNTPSRFQTSAESSKLMTEFSQHFGLQKSTHNIYNDLTIEDGIINFTKLINADLVAITPDGFWRLAHMFNKNITTELMKKSLKVILSMKTH